MSNLRKTLPATLAAGALAALALSVPAHAVPGNRVITASGELVDEPTEGCEEAAFGCFYAVEGSLVGTEVGAGSFVLFLDLDSGAEPDAFGCQSVGGDLIATTADRSELVLEHRGTLCTLPAAGEDPAPLLYNGAFMIVDGDRRFSGRVGAGRLTVGVESDGNATLHLQGAFR